MYDHLQLRELTLIHVSKSDIWCCLALTALLLRLADFPAGNKLSHAVPELGKAKRCFMTCDLTYHATMQQRSWQVNTTHGYTCYLIDFTNRVWLLRGSCYALTKSDKGLFRRLWYLVTHHGRNINGDLVNPSMCGCFINFGRCTRHWPHIFMRFRRRCN